MKFRLLLPLLLLSPWFTAPAAEPPPRPNIIFILADDLGFGDIGVFFQNERQERNDRSQPWHLTPQLDAMAAQGIQLRDHYCPSPVCAPSRASLMLGVHQGHANVRDNQFDKALENNHTLATVLKGAGYATAAIGKWGLQGGEKGNPAKQSPANWPAYPTKRGFDYYFGYVRHEDGHAHYPKEDGKQVWENDREISASLAGCYTTDLFTARAKQWIVEQRSAHASQPFFLYLAYDTPHAKLVLPPGPYPAGSGRHGGVQWLGQPGAAINTASGQPDSYMHPDYAEATWDHDHNPATPERPWPDVYRRYATDVRRIDDCVGDLLALLRDLKIDESTIVVFASDNGPSQESYLPQPFEANFFDSYGPHDGIKRDVWEGGIRVGAITRWPGAIPAGGVSREPSQFHDWMPTFAALAGVPAPARTDGVSLLPTLLGTGKQELSRIYVEYFFKGKTPSYSDFVPAHRGRTRAQMQALRIGDYLGVRYNVTSHADPFEIYRIDSDPKEAENLAGRPDLAWLQQQMHDTVLQVRRPTPSAPRPYDDEFVPPSPAQELAPGLVWSSYERPTPWLAKLEEWPASAQGLQPQFDLSHAPESAEGSLLFSGVLEAPEDGVYTFRLQAESDALLRLHEAAVIDLESGFSASHDATGTIRLQKGPHPIRLYYRHAGPAKPRLSLEWNLPGQPPAELPASVLFHAAHPASLTNPSPGAAGTR